MTEKELGKALVDRDRTADGVGPAEQATTALARHNRRLTLLTAFTVCLWLFAAAGILVFHFGFLIFFLPKINQLLSHPDDPKLQAHWGGVVHAFETVSVPVVTAGVAAMVLAAICTVLLILASRRATLRQVNAHLAEISEQLRQLRHALQTRPS